MGKKTISQNYKNSDMKLQNSEKKTNKIINHFKNEDHFVRNKWANKIDNAMWDIRQKKANFLTRKKWDKKESQENGRCGR